MTTVNNSGSKNIVKYMQAAVLFGSIMIPLIALAQLVGDLIPPPGALDISSPGQLQRPIERAVSFLGSLTFAVSVVVLMYAGFLYVTAGENEDAVSRAKSLITWAIVGVVVAMSAWAVPLFIVSFF